MKFITVISLSCLLWLGSCCCIQQRQVGFSDLQATHHADNNRVVRIYLDKYGHYYPENLYIPYRDFFGNGNDNVYKAKPATGNLKKYFISHPSVLQEACKSYGIVYNSTDLEATFNDLQEVIIQHYAGELNGLLLSEGHANTLFALIHGFNETDPTGSYQQLRDIIRTDGFDRNDQAVYLELYWDGLTANNGNPIFAKIWGRAQENSVFVGIGLRRLLVQVNAKVPVRIITHSLGASVGTAILFNTISKWKKPPTCDWTTACPSQDVRLGMLAPAIPGVSTFHDFNSRSPHPILPENNLILRIVVGFNPKDYAVSKSFWKFKLSKHFGATSLGADADYHGVHEIERTQKELVVLGYDSNILVPVSFLDSNTPHILRKQHQFYYYLINDNIHAFLRALLVQ